MKRLCTTVAILTLSGGLALAQSGGGAAAAAQRGSSSSGAAASRAARRSHRRHHRQQRAAQQQSGAGTSTTPGGTSTARTTAAARCRDWRRPSARRDLTVGRGPGVNPANPQDASRRGNPSDRTLPGARNPQDMKAFDNGVPQIIKPER